MFQSFIFTVLCITSFTLANPPLPVLPNQFIVDVEANIIDQNLTLSQIEYYDFTNLRSRFEINTLNSETVILEDIKNNKAFNVTNGICVSDGPLNNFTASLRTVNQLLQFGAEYNETYVGVSNVRGVPCNSWISNILYTSGSVVHNLTLQFYFTVPSWGFREENVTTKPMRATLIGTRTYPNTTVYLVNHYYEFINFIAKQPDETLFAYPVACGYNVPKFVELFYGFATTPEGAGLVAGMFFFGLFLGIIIMGIIFVVKRRRERARNFALKSTPMSERGDE